VNETHEDLEEVVKEWKIYKKLDHPNIAKILFYYVVKHIPILVMEYPSKGSLQQLIEIKNPNVAWKNKGHSIVLDVAKAILECHQHGLVCAYLSTATVLITENYEAKIVQYGRERFPPASLGTYLVSPYTPADDKFSIEDDIWRIGILMWEVLTGSPAILHSQTRKQLLQLIPADWHPELNSDKIPDDLYNLLKRCWMERSSRPTIQEFIQVFSPLCPAT